MEAESGQRVQFHQPEGQPSGQPSGWTNRQEVDELLIAVVLTHSLLLIGLLAFANFKQESVSVTLGDCGTVIGVLNSLS